MRDVVNAGAVELIAATVADGATPAAARKWWSGELARRAKAQGRELADMGSPLRPSPSWTGSCARVGSPTR